MDLELDLKQNEIDNFDENPINFGDIYLGKSFSKAITYNNIGVDFIVIKKPDNIEIELIDDVNSNDNSKLRITINPIEKGIYCNYIQFSNNNRLFIFAKVNKNRRNIILLFSLLLFVFFLLCAFLFIDNQNLKKHISTIDTKLKNDAINFNKKKHSDSLAFVNIIDSLYQTNMIDSLEYLNRFSEYVAKYNNLLRTNENQFKKISYLSSQLEYKSKKITELEKNSDCKRILKKTYSTISSELYNFYTHIDVNIKKKNIKKGNNTNGYVRDAIYSKYKYYQKLAN